MSEQIDLMPASCKARLRLKRWSRRWIMLYAASAAAVVLGAGSLRVQQMADRAEYSRLRRELELDADYQRQVRVIAEEMARLATAIKRHERISWPVELSDVIHVMGEVMPEAVTLTSFAVTPRLEPELPGVKTDGPPRALGLTVEIAGVAPTDLDVAGLIAGLEGHPIFERVTIDFARSTKIRGVTAREFGLSCDVDFSSLRPKASAAAPQEAR